MRDGCHGSFFHRRRCSYSLMNSITEMGPYINTRLRARLQTHLWPQRNNLDPRARPPCVYRVTHRAKKRPGFMFVKRETTGARRSTAANSASASEPRGWTAPEPRLISSFCPPFRMIRFSSLCTGRFSESRRGFFPATFSEKMQTLSAAARASSTLCLSIFCKCCGGGGLFSLRCDCQTDILSHKMTKL